MRVELAVASAGFAATIACGSPTSPTNGVTPDFIVAVGMNVLAIGSSARMTATAFTRSMDPNAYAKGVQQTADISSAASWSSDNPAIASVSSGTVTGRAAGSTAVRVSYMGRQYDIPVSVVAPSALADQFAGMWSGGMNRYCSDLVGDTRSCFGQSYIAPENVAMTLTNMNGVLQGTIDMGDGIRFSHITGPITAGIDAGGRLVVGGAPRIFGDEEPEQLRDWSFAMSGRQLTGSGSSDSGFINIYGVVWTRTTYTDIALR